LLCHSWCSCPGGYVRFFHNPSNAILHRVRPLCLVEYEPVFRSRLAVRETTTRQSIGIFFWCSSQIPPYLIQLPFNPASLFLASSTSGNPGSASFQRSRNFSQFSMALAVSPCCSYILPSM